MNSGQANTKCVKLHIGHFVPGAGVELVEEWWGLVESSFTVAECWDVYDFEVDDNDVLQAWSDLARVSKNVCNCRQVGNSFSVSDNSQYCRVVESRFSAKINTKMSSQCCVGIPNKCNWLTASKNESSWARITGPDSFANFDIPNKVFKVEFAIYRLLLYLASKAFQASR